jgi:cytosine/adenosine deaminase-related metal-dependent hydrolase
MVTGIKSKVGEIAENKAVSTVVLDLTNSHEKVRINAVQSESKLKNL